MNDIINKFLLAGDKFMPETHLRQPGITYSACGPFTKTQEHLARFKETGDTKHIYRNTLDKACFQHDLAYGNKDIPTRTAADKVLRDKAFDIAQDQSKDGYQRSLAAMVYKFFNKKTQGSGLADELHKRIVRKFEIYLTTFTFYEPELQKTIKDVYRIEKIIRRRGNKVLVKWKGYPSSQNSWIDKSKVINIK